MVTLKEKKLDLNVEASNGNERRSLMFAAAAAFVCSVAYFPCNDRNKNYFFIAYMKNLNNLHLE